MNRGFSLLELLVSLVLSIVLVAVISHMYVNISQQHVWRIQQNVSLNKLHYAALILPRLLKETGFIGCARLQNDFNLHNPYSDAIDFSAATSLQALGSQHLQIYKASGVALVSLQQDMVDDWSLSLPTPHEFKPGDLILISDCKRADLNKIKAIKGSEITLAQPLSYHYQKFSAVSKLERLQLYFKDNALWLKSLTGFPVELIDDLQDMQLYYQITPKIWLIHEEIHDWLQVKRVRIALSFKDMPQKNIDISLRARV